MHAAQVTAPTADIVPALHSSQSELDVLPLAASEVPGGHLAQMHSVLQLGAPM
eukprot:CAMPEP_0171780524 /NCGR_PEP_ID=MMETSP0991-20121206/59671_1 /TAXON_ID=483369 /ORGANISM="non described non described, Strain CCMP2098" /LENGTH=52 /DNA_ID=CAMNT_0012387931 /DNA_START=56 /DNA_END=211 /DNA_ORIENTATION=-